MGTIAKLYLEETHLLIIHEHLTSSLPNEACGILAGIKGQSVHVFITPNRLRSPVLFDIEPQALWQAFRTIEEKDWDFLAIFHSHPLGPNHLSSTDLDNHHYPDVVQLLFYRNKNEWEQKAFIVAEKVSREIKLAIVTN